MRALILSAGRGERLRPLTDSCPKPLIALAGKPLLQWHIEKLRAAGITEIVINSAWLGSMIVDFAGDGSAFGVRISHSREGAGGLETAGGIIKALPLLTAGAEEFFLTVNGDTLIDGDYAQLLQAVPYLQQYSDLQAFLFLTANPEHHRQGDFSLAAGSPSAIIKGGDYTFSGAAVYRKSAFAGLPEQRLPLRPLFDKWVQSGQLGGRVLAGKWFDVGTIQRLQQAEAYLSARL